MPAVEVVVVDESKVSSTSSSSFLVYKHTERERQV
jgi:hypothetical protein